MSAWDKEGAPSLLASLRNPRGEGGGALCVETNHRDGSTDIDKILAENRNLPNYSKNCLRLRRAPMYFLT